MTLSVIVHHKDEAELTEEQSAQEAEIAKKIHEALGSDLPEPIQGISIGRSEDVIVGS